MKSNVVSPTKIYFLVGLGAGVIVTGMALAPQAPSTDTRYKTAVILGLLILMAGLVLGWYVQRQSVKTVTKDNLTSLFKKGQGRMEIPRVTSRYRATEPPMEKPNAQ
jgi:hypothetical protein